MVAAAAGQPAWLKQASCLAAAVGLPAEVKQCCAVQQCSVAPKSLELATGVHVNHELLKVVYIFLLKWTWGIC